MSLNKTCISTTEICFTNIELVTNICKFLTYQEQIELQNVSSGLKHIIVDFVWKTKFKEIELMAFYETRKILITDQIDRQSSDYLCDVKECEILQRNNLFFNTKEMEVFLNLNASNIKSMQLTAWQNYERLIVKFPLKENLRNLTYLSYLRMTLTNEDLRRVAVICGQLETLILFNCLNLEGQSLIVGKHIDIDILKNMTNLKNFIINDHSLGSSQKDMYTLTNVQNILSQLNLQCLQLNVKILSDSSTMKTQFNFSNLKCCKNLQIGPFVNCLDYHNFQINILPNFKELCSFYLNGFQNNVVITEDLFNILRKCCQHLVKISINDCCVKDFIALPKLQEITIRDCRGLTFAHLKIILNEMHLKSFKSLFTAYKGDFEYFPISSSLQKLTCNFISENLLQLLKLNRLITLTYFNWNIYTFENLALNLTNFAPNLKVLHIPQIKLNTEDCLKLKFLQKIVLTSHSEILVSELLSLLKHEFLRDLSIDYVDTCNVDVAKPELVAFPTNLISLNVPSIIMEMMTDFCLDLLDVNRKLSFKCFNITYDLVMSVLSNEKFPHRFNYINICGFSIACVSIRDQCAATMDLIKLLVDLFKYFGKRYFILESF